MPCFFFIFKAKDINEDLKPDVATQGKYRYSTPKYICFKSYPMKICRFVTALIIVWLCTSLKFGPLADVEKYLPVLSNLFANLCSKYLIMMLFKFKFFLHLLRIEFPFI